MTARVLMVDDDRAMCEMVQSALQGDGLEIESVQSGEEALALLRSADYDAVLTDLNMKGMNGLELCARVAASGLDTPVIVVTAFGSLETAIGAIRAGAYDFVTKPIDLDLLRIIVERTVRHRALSREVARLRRTVAQARRFEDLIGASPAMQAVYDLVERVAETDASVLVTGESGTGKELVARALHRRSRRRNGPFVAVDCAAMPEALLESELFGHAKGAFTDARGARVGLFVEANGGTLLLDEVGELPLTLQPKLLRALQERRVRPVGSNAEVAFDARVVSATNRDLEAAVEEGRFRADLYFRLDVVHIPLPPLRARGGDTLLLAQYFLEHYATLFDKPVRALSAGAAEKISAYAWPGNVRELANCIERAVALARSSELIADDLPERVRDYRRSHVLISSDDPSEIVPLEEVEKRYLLRVLDAAGGNRTLAAKLLGLDRKTLYRKLKSYGVGDEGAS